MEDYKVIIGERLKHLRKSKRVQVQEILHYLDDMPRSTYTGYELGTRTPKGKNLVKLAQFYNTSVDYLTGKTDDPYIYQVVDNDIEKIIKSGNVTYKGKHLTKEQQFLISNLIKTVIDSSSNSNDL